MTPFAFLSAQIRAIIALWALILCLVNIGSAVLAAARRRLRFIAYALVVFAPVYFLWQVIFDFSLLENTGEMSTLTEKLCSVSWLYPLSALSVFTVTSALLFGMNLRYDRTFITPGTIKLYLDKIPCGICCWRKNGRVLFSNICMNDLCAGITGNPLLNGNHFCDAVNNRMFTVRGKAWRFACREIEYDGEPLFEMIATDITDGYAKTAALEKDKAELSRLNKELRDYYLSIDESVHRQEILQAKMNIHDEMNRLMLKTVAADKGDTRALDKIFSLWEQNALLLCMEADNKTSAGYASSLDSLANALGVSLIWKGELPQSLGEKEKELFFFTAQEAVVNAVKHARAKTVEIAFEKTENALLCRFSNDGSLPDSEVRFEGGLANIASIAEKQRAEIFLENGERFTLVLKYHTIG